MTDLMNSLQLLYLVDFKLIFAVEKVVAVWPVNFYIFKNISLIILGAIIVMNWNLHHTTNSVTNFQYQNICKLGFKNSDTKFKIFIFKLS